MNRPKRRCATRAMQQITEMQDNELFAAIMHYGKYFHRGICESNSQHHMPLSHNLTENNIHQIKYFWLPRVVVGPNGDPKCIVPIIWNQLDGQCYEEKLKNILQSHCDFLNDELNKNEIKKTYNKKDHKFITNEIKEWKREEKHKQKCFKKGQLVLLNAAVVPFAVTAPVARIRFIERRHANKNINIIHMKQKRDNKLTHIINSSGFIGVDGIVRIISENEDIYHLASQQPRNNDNNQNNNNNNQINDNNDNNNSNQRNDNAETQQIREQIREEAFKEIAIADLHQQLIYIGQRIWTNLKEIINKRHGFKYHFEKYSLDLYERGGCEELIRISKKNETINNVEWFRNLSWRFLLGIVGVDLLKRKQGNNEYMPAQIDAKYEKHNHKLTLYYLVGRVDGNGIPWCNIPITYIPW